MVALGTSEASDLLASGGKCWWSGSVTQNFHKAFSRQHFSSHKWWLIPHAPYNIYNGTFIYMMYCLNSALQLLESFHSRILHQTELRCHTACRGGNKKVSESRKVK